MLQDQSTFRVVSRPGAWRGSQSATGSASPRCSTAKRVLWEFVHIPPIPHIALRVLDCVSHDGFSMCYLSDLISTDAALSSEVLTIANSPLIPHRFPVTNIMQAVARLGTYTLRGLCLTVAVRSYLGQSMNYRPVRAAWRHSLATALIAGQLVEAGFVNVDDAHTAGILHEIGRLGLAVVYPANYSRLLETHTGTPESIREKERELFEFDHVEVGHHLVDDWGLPGDFHAAVGHAECSDEEGKPLELDRLIHMSCRMADIAGFPAFSGCTSPPFEEVLATLTRQQQAHFYPDRSALASDIGSRIAAYEAL